MDHPPTMAFARPLPSALSNGRHEHEKPAGYGGFFIAETNGPSSGADRAGASLKERYSRSYGAPLDAKTSTLRLLALLNLDRNQK